MYYSASKYKIQFWQAAREKKLAKSYPAVNTANYNKDSSGKICPTV